MICGTTAPTLSPAGHLGENRARMALPPCLEYIIRPGTRGTCRFRRSDRIMHPTLSFPKVKIHIVGRSLEASNEGESSRKTWKLTRGDYNLLSAVHMPGMALSSSLRLHSKHASWKLVSAPFSHRLKNQDSLSLQSCLNSPLVKGETGI